MGLFSKKKSVVDEYINSEVAQRMLAESRERVDEAVSERRAAAEFDRAERRKAREAAALKAREARAHTEGLRAYENVMSGRDTDEEWRAAAPKSPPKAGPAEARSLWPEALAATGIALAGLFLSEDEAVPDEERYSAEKSRALTDQSRKALDEAMSVRGHISWSEYPDLRELFQHLDAASQWRVQAEEESDDVREEFRLCLDSALEAVNLHGPGAELVTTQSSSLYGLYLKWQRAIFK